MNWDDNGTNNLNVSWDINLKKKKMDLGRGERKEKEEKGKDEILSRGDRQTSNLLKFFQATSIK